MSGLTKAHVAGIAKAADSSLSAKITKALSNNGAKPGAAAHALALKPMSAPQRRKLLYALVTSDPDAAARLALLAKVDSRLRVELPARMANTPVTPRNFGLSTPDQVIDLVTARLSRMETGARSLAEFQVGLDGWRRNVVGSLLFERIVKYDPQLDVFFREVGGDLIGLINQEIDAKPRALLGVDGKRRTVSQRFGAPQKIVKVTLVGPDGVPREFTDFGQLAPNPQGWSAFLPIEVKLERALAGVSGQFSEFRPRLSVAKSMVAIVLEGGKEVERSIDPAQLVFLSHDLAQTAVAPTGAKQLVAIRAKGSIAPGSVASVTDFGPAVSRKYQSMHYRARVLVDRGWLEELVMPLTDP
jgi:hypothetical protein